VELVHNDDPVAKEIPEEDLKFPITVSTTWPVVTLCKVIEDAFAAAHPDSPYECEVFCLSKGDQSRFNYNLPLITYFQAGDKLFAQCEILKTAPPKKDSDKLPVTILTGFLGAGKTTLLNYILKEQNEHKFFVIQNEFGEISIDDELTRNNFADKEAREEQVISLDNGCMCCAVRGDLASAFQSILQGYLSKKYDIEAVLVETTGMADPRPVVATFSKIPGITDHMRLDCIVTVVGCNTIIKQVSRKVDEEDKVNEAIEQIIAADRIILNKQDLVDSSEMKSVKDVIRSLNSYARLLPSTRSRVDLDKIMNVQAFSLEKMAIDASFFEEAEEEVEAADEHAHGHGHGKEHHGHGHGHAKEHHGHGHGHAEENHGHGHGHGKEHHGHGHGHAEEHHGHGHGDPARYEIDDHGHGHDHGHAHGHGCEDDGCDHHSHGKQRVLHESGISSVGFKVKGEIEIAKFQAFFATLNPEDMYRTKGIMKIKGEKRKFVFHGVHDLIDHELVEHEWSEDEEVINKIVFIGRNLDKEALLEAFKKCLVEPDMED